MTYRYRYGAWDGSQEPFDLHADEVMDEISNDLFNDGSVARALNRLMQRGMKRRDGQQRTMGVRDMMERLKQRRQQQLDKYDMGSVLDGIKEKLEDIVKTEREGIDKRMDEARKRAAQQPEQGKALQTMQNLANKRRDTLDQLPEEPAGQIKELSQYDFMDPEARRKFEELMEQLKQRMMEQYFKDMQQAMKGITPEQMQAMKDMLKELNQMMQQQAQGQPTDEAFQQFMQQYGGMFGDRPPSNMDELLEELANRMAQAQSLLDSMPEETRQQMMDLMDSLMDDEMREQMAQLSEMMEQLMPMDDMRRQYPFSGEQELSMEEAMKLMDQLQQMEQLENQLKGIRGPGDLERVDEEKIAELLGEEAKRSWEQLKEMMKRLEEAGYIRRKGDKVELTPRGIRKIGQKAIRDIFAQLKKDRVGAHQLYERGLGGEHSGDTKPWEFGDDFAVDLQKSLMNSVKREGAGTPLRMKTHDFEVLRPEHSTTAATCLLLDRSRSMGYYGNFAAAKKVAIALNTLIRSQYPRDHLYIIGFSDVAIEFKDDDLPELSWDTGISGTNMHHAFMMSRKLLSKHKGGTRQIIMVTDGEPTAYLDHGVPYFSYPPSPATISETLKEARRCAKEGIIINTFMLENSYPLIDFIRLLSRMNRGRAFYSAPEKLGEYVLEDFIANRKRHIA